MNYINKEHQSIQETYIDSINYVFRDLFASKTNGFVEEEQVNIILSAFDSLFSDFLKDETEVKHLIPMLKVIVLRVNWRATSEQEINTVIKNGKQLINQLLAYVRK